MMVIISIITTSVIDTASITMHQGIIDTIINLAMVMTDITTNQEGIVAHVIKLRQSNNHKPFKEN